MNETQSKRRLRRYFSMMDREIFLTDNSEELLLFASALMTYSTSIYKNILGESGLDVMLEFHKQKTKSPNQEK